MALALAPQWPRAGFSPALPVILLIAGLASAHDHHGGESKIPEGHTVSEEPIVSERATAGLCRWG
jgi:hypothetical protein